MTVRIPILPPLALTTICLCAGLSGCVAEDNGSTLDLGSVSIGKQLIDLQKARDAGAITKPEYLKLKAELLTLVGTAMTSSDEEDAAPKDIEIHIEHNDDERSGFLF